MCFYACLIGYGRTHPAGAQSNANLHLKSMLAKMGLLEKAFKHYSVPLI